MLVNWLWYNVFIHLTVLFLLTVTFVLNVEFMFDLVVYKFRGFAYFSMFDWDGTKHNLVLLLWFYLSVDNLSSFFFSIGVICGMIWHPIIQVSGHFCFPLPLPLPVSSMFDCLCYKDSWDLIWLVVVLCYCPSENGMDCVSYCVRVWFAIEEWSRGVGFSALQGVSQVILLCVGF